MDYLSDITFNQILAASNLELAKFDSLLELSRQHTQALIKETERVTAMIESYKI